MGGGEGGIGGPAIIRATLTAVVGVYLLVLRRAGLVPGACRRLGSSGSACLQPALLMIEGGLITDVSGVPTGCGALLRPTRLPFVVGGPKADALMPVKGRRLTDTATCWRVPTGGPWPAAATAGKSPRQRDW